MNRVTILEEGMLVGAAVPLSEVFEKCQELIQTRGSHQTQVMSAIVDMLKKYGGLQIRNLACIGGNLVTASPIADMNPILLAARSQLNIASADKSHRVLYLEQSFFSAYRKVALEPDEVLISVQVDTMDVNLMNAILTRTNKRGDEMMIFL